MGRVFELMSESGYIIILRGGKIGDMRLALVTFFRFHRPEI